MSDAKPSKGPGTDFIRQIVAADVASGRHGGRVVTRFPPEPNGYLHIGHAKAICLSFGIAEEFGGRCHLRFDDTNPETEEEEYVESMQEDIRWLGFDWGEHLYFASDYFERMYECAQILIRKGLAYVDSSTEEEIREARGTVTEPGRPTAFRDRSVEENLDLFRRMRAGEFPDGAHVLRAKIDLAASNMIMRDPVLYRIRHAHHFRQGDAWCIYPLYDYAHCLEDAFEDVTHSLCTLEFENNREIYDWILDNVGFEEPRTHQYEFNRLNLQYTVVSKRKLRPLVESGYLSGWDDPRMSTLAGLRRRGIPADAIRRFVEMAGVAKAESWLDPGKLEYAIREVLNPVAPRVMAVLKPLKVVITNFPDAGSEDLEAPYYPRDIPLEGVRIVPFGREIWIERSDFSENPPEGFRRLVRGGEVRLRYAYVVRCDEVVKDAEGEVVELRCSYDPDTRSGTGSGRKGIGTIHWVSAAHARDAEVRLVDRLFSVPDPEELPEGAELASNLNPDSLVVVRGAKVEPSVAEGPLDIRYQFERTGYFWRDPVDGAGDRLVFNRIVPLRDTWSKRVETRPAALTTEGGAPEVQVSGARSGEGSTSSKPRVSADREGKRRADEELAARFSRYVNELGIATEDADVLTGSRAASDFFEGALAVHADAQAIASWMVNDLRGLQGDRTIEDVAFTPEALGRLVAMVDGGSITGRAGKDVLAEMLKGRGEPEEIVERAGLEKIGDTEKLEPVVEKVLAAWPAKVDEYRAGKASLMGLFVGEVMKATRGAADPKVVRSVLEARLERPS
jgi:glutaminyl-tRNA synthetase